MKYSITIDNLSSKKWGLTIQEAYLFSWIYALPSWANKVSIEGVDFYFASKNKVAEELPLLTDKIDTVYRYMKRLELKGLIALKKVDNKDYVALTPLAKTWNSVPSEHSENNPTNLGRSSEVASEKNPTYNNIKEDTSTINKRGIDFDIFWDLYDKKIGKIDSKKAWDKLHVEDQRKIIKDIPTYRNQISDLKFQMNPLTYLTGQHWKDERYSKDRLGDPVPLRKSLNEKYQ